MMNLVNTTPSCFFESDPYSYPYILSDQQSGTEFLSVDIYDNNSDPAEWIVYAVGSEFEDSGESIAVAINFQDSSLIWSKYILPDSGGTSEIGI